MSIETTSTSRTAETAAGARPPWRAIVVGVVIAALVAGLAAAITYRQTVRSERSTVFYSALQAQSIAAFDEMALMGFDRVPRDAVAMEQVVSLRLTDLYPSRIVSIAAGEMRLQGDTLYVVVDAMGSNGDLPGWVGDLSFYESILLFGTYLSGDGAVSSDEGSCMIRHGSPSAPAASGTVRMTDQYYAEACTPEQLRAAGIA